MKLKKLIRDYFIFTKRERNAVMGILICTLLVLIFPSAQNKFSKQKAQINYDSLNNLLASIPQENNFQKTENDDNYNYFDKDEKRNNYSYEKYSKNNFDENKSSYTLFNFDPNTISKDEWLQLGMQTYVADRIINYRNTGAQFKKKDDLLKVYGFNEVDFERLKDYIVIDTTIFQNKKINYETATVSSAEKQITEINSATAEQIIALGFSKYNAEKIIKFRDDAGGLYSVEQLNTFYGIDTAVLNQNKNYLIADVSKIIKININTATLEQFAKHAYISDELAKAIIDYRNTTGKFYSVSEIMKVKGMYKSLFEKLKPYLII